MSPRLRAAARELPWILGAALAVAMLVRNGGAFRLDDFPEGQAWRDYLYQAELQVSGHGEGFKTAIWPLYPWLLGTLGEHMGYVDAGLFVASLALVACVLSAAIGARSLAGPWAGALAALAVSHAKLAPQACRWINLYPVLGAFTGMALAAGVAWVRWGRPWLAPAAGAFTGLAWATDWRGAVVVPVVAALLLLGARPLQAGRATRLGAVVCAAILVAAGPWLSIHGTNLDLTPWNMGVLGQDAASGAPLPSPVEILRAGMTRPFTWDQRDVFLHLLPFGWFPTLFALAFWLLPGRRGGRVLAAGAVVALFAVLLPAGFRVMALKHRYLLQAMVPLALLAPVGLFRFLYTALPRKAAWSAAPLLTVVGAVWLHAFGPVVGEVFDEADKKDMLPIIYLVRNYVGPGDTLLDCSWSGVEVAFLPRRFHPTRVDLRHSDPYACFRWLDAPEGGEDDRWIIVFQRPQVTFPDTARLAGDSRWTKVASTGDPNTTGVTLWRWVGPASGGSVAP